MYKISFGVFCLVLVVIFGNAMIVTGQSAEDQMCIPMGNIVLKPPESVEAKRAPVDFNHPTHFDFRCQTCHHKWIINEPIVGCYTTGCHDVTEAPKPSANGAIDKELAARYYKKAYHTLCIGCHKEIHAQNKELEMSGRTIKEKLPNSGPISCIQCHPKEEE